MLRRYRRHGLLPLRAEAGYATARPYVRRHYHDIDFIIVVYDA